MTDKTFSIVIPVFNKWNFTKSCLSDLSKLSDDHEIIIVNNASTDETADELIKLADEWAKDPTRPYLHYFNNTANTFHSKACNQGYNQSIGKHILFLNNDIRIKSNHQNWTQTLVVACDDTGGLVGPTMGLLDKNLNFVKEANQQLEGNSYLGGWCIAGSREAWEKLRIGKSHQIWNEDFPFYFNDTDLSFRARKLGVPITHVPLPEAAHFGKISAAQINIPKLYQEGRNVFLRKWAGKNR
jgi:O-antigen biosynthesis protein